MMRLTSMKGLLSLCMTLLASLMLLGDAHADAIDWMATQQQTDGSIPSTNAISSSLQSTTQAIAAIVEAGRTSQLNTTTATTYLNSVTDTTTETLARQLMILGALGEDISTQKTQLLGYQNTDGGFGELKDYGSTAIDTAYALLALNSAGVTDSTAIHKAVARLLQLQQADGGFILAQPNDSSVYVAAIASLALQGYLFTYDVGPAIKRVSDYLLSQKPANGDWGSDWETALALMALSPVTLDSTVYSGAVTNLRNHQALDGSWDSDVYVTALAQQALATIDSAVQPVNLTQGIFTGSVVDNNTGTRLAGVTVTAKLANATTSYETTTADDGRFRLQNIPAGNYDLIFAISGYSSILKNASIIGGQLLDVGVTGLSPVANTAILQGVIRDAETGAGIAAATITLTGSTNISLTTDSLGVFRTTVVPGSISVTASATGYYTASGSTNILAGQTVNFSPSLTPTTLPPKPAGVMVTGMVVDSQTYKAIANASVEIVGSTSVTVTTDATGKFTATNVEAGDLTLVISAAGYQTSEDRFIAATGTIVNLGYQYLVSDTPTASSTVSGIVTDATTGLPLSGVAVVVDGTSLSGTTDASGGYSISGINQLNFSLLASTAGYLSSFSSLTFAEPTSATVDFVLTPASVDGLTITSLSTDRPDYMAYDTSAIAATIQNAGTNSQSIKIALDVMGADGQLIQRLLVGDPGVTSTHNKTFVVLPGITKDINSSFEVNALAPGNYIVSLKLFDEYSNAMLAEKTTSISVMPTEAIEQLDIKATPRYTNVGQNVQLKLEANLVNRSNIESTLVFQYQIKAPDGDIIFDNGYSLTMLPIEKSSRTTILDTPYAFTESGNYTVEIQVTSGPIPQSIAIDGVSVAPTVRVEANQGISPVNVVPDGDERIRINLQVKGVSSK